jgi:broad specificity phosphatase PhoE
LINPLKPSWGESYRAVSARIFSLFIDMYKELKPGEEGIIVSHQAPIWVLRRKICQLPLAHNPYSRGCSLASITSFTISDLIVEKIWYMQDVNSIEDIRLDHPYKLSL